MNSSVSSRSRARSGFSIVLLIAALSGCELVQITEDVSYDHPDQAVPSGLVDSIKVGSTHKDWLINELGAPDKIDSLDNGGERYQYRFTQQLQKRLRIFLVFQYRNRETRESLLIIDLKDDVVQSVSFDGAASLDTEQT